MPRLEAFIGVSVKQVEGSFLGYCDILGISLERDGTLSTSKDKLS